MAGWGQSIELLVVGLLLGGCSAPQDIDSQTATAAPAAATAPAVNLEGCTGVAVYHYPDYGSVRQAVPAIYEPVVWLRYEASHSEAILRLEVRTCSAAHVATGSEADVSLAWTAVEVYIVPDQRAAYVPEFFVDRNASPRLYDALTANGWHVHDATIAWTSEGFTVETASSSYDARTTIGLPAFGAGDRDEVLLGGATREQAIRASLTQDLADELPGGGAYLTASGAFLGNLTKLGVRGFFPRAVWEDRGGSTSIAPAEPRFRLVV